MLRLTLELIPGGNSEKKEVLGVMNIINRMDHHHRPEKGNYDVLLSRVNPAVLASGWKVQEISRTGQVQDFSRHLGAWRLLALALKSLYL